VLRLRPPFPTDRARGQPDAKDSTEPRVRFAELGTNVDEGESSKASLTPAYAKGDSMSPPIGQQYPTVLKND
jgi:hypothetical protein